MKEYMGYLGILLVVIILIMFFYISGRKIQEYSTNLFYMDTYIKVKVYSKNENKAKKVLTEIDNIYKKYHELTDRYNEYKDLKNIHYINNNNDKIDKIKLDKELYDILKYSKDWYAKSSGLLNINLGNVIDIWKQYRENKDGIPSLEELKGSGSTNIEDIVLLDNNYILNNHPNIDLGAISKGYTTEVVGKYLKEQGFDRFLIYAGGNILVGNHYYNDLYKIGIEDPTKAGEIYKIIKCENIAVVTSGGYERFYEYNGQLYHHIIDPDTLMPPNYMKSVTVVTDNSSLGDVLSTILFLMPINEGKTYIEQFNNVEVIWYSNEGEIIKSTGFGKYE